jgi:hypothetical protein
MKYEAPSIDLPSFTCPICGVLAGIEWSRAYVRKYGDMNKIFDSYVENASYDLYVSTCRACDGVHFWVNGKRSVTSFS